MFHLSLGTLFICSTKRGPKFWLYTYENVNEFLKRPLFLLGDPQMAIFAVDTIYCAMKVFQNTKTEKLSMSKFAERMLSGSFWQQNVDYQTLTYLNHVNGVCVHNGGFLDISSKIT